MRLSLRILLTVTLAVCVIGCKVEREVHHRDSPDHPRLAPAIAVAAEASPLVGRTARVNFRRDALGMAGQGPIEPGATSFARKPMFLEGTIEQCSDSWLVLRQAGSTLWIPTSAVLTIELTGHPEQ